MSRSEIRCLYGDGDRLTDRPPKPGKWGFLRLRGNGKSWINVKQVLRLVSFGTATVHTDGTVSIKSVHDRRREYAIKYKGCSPAKPKAVDCSTAAATRVTMIVNGGVFEKNKSRH